MPHPINSETVLNRSTAHALDSVPHHRDLMPAGLFGRMLCLERKRAERSGRRLVLLLLEATAGQSAARREAFEKLALLLSKSARDTDITGWYREQQILGVLFTEIPATHSTTVSILSAKAKGIVLEAFGADGAREINISLHVFPDDFEGPDGGRRAFSILYPDFAQEIESKRLSFAAKRAIDVLGSLALLVLLFPLLLLIACLVRLTSNGSILFRQHRLGHFGETFTLMKFRSMRANADPSIHQQYVKRLISKQGRSTEHESGSEFKLKCDPRITKVGALLRRTSLDEFPQLFNVLRGEMSLVGPRPPLPYELEVYESWHRGRLLSKPGITGIWQVGGRSRVTFDDMVRMDLQYARTWSLWLDIKLLVRTPLAVLSCDGAY